MIWGFSKAKAWRSIMTSEPFEFRGEKVLYGTGQPMGAYSSWPMLAITHHTIVRVAAERAKFNPINYSNYM
jgi:hypothetical protein